MTTPHLRFTPMDTTGHGWIVAGELDAHTAKQLAAWLAVREAEPTNVAELRLDVSGVTFVDSVGLTTLADAAAALRARGRRLVLVRPGDAMLRLVQAARLDGQLEVEHLSPSA